MKLKIHKDPAPLRIDDRSGGVIRVGPTRITLNLLISEYERGRSPEEIIRSFDTLSLADVYATIGYYLRHKAEVDAYLREVRAEEDRIEAEIRAQQEKLGIRERLLARQRKMAKPG